MKAVVDFHGNREHAIRNIARIIGKDVVRQGIFNCIYGRTRRPLSKLEIMDKASIDSTKSQQVTNGLVILSNNHIIHSDGRRNKVYSKNDFVLANIRAIRRAISDTKFADNLVEKRYPAVKTVVSNSTKVVYKYNGTKIDVKEIFIDDIDQFSKVKSIIPRTKDLSDLSEDAFKRGIGKLVGENSVFKDWGGEKSDMLTTQVKIGGVRVATVFAFKGPGMNAILTPAKMGKNGDQALRLFEENADLYIVQHWREISSSVRVLMHALAVARSVMVQKKIYYCIIDGQDSVRLVDAYANFFEK